MVLVHMPQDTLSRFAIEVFRVNDALFRNGNRLTKQLGQSSARWQVLGRVGNQPQTVAGIAKSMGYARQSVQRVAHALVKDGLAAYQPNPADKRAQLLAVTPAGARMLAAIHARNMAWAEHILTKLDAQQLAQLADQLKAVTSVLEADEQDKETPNDNK